MPKLVCSVKDAATLMGVGRTFTYELIKQGRLETVKLGRRTLIKMDSITALIGGAICQRRSDSRP